MKLTTRILKKLNKYKLCYINENFAYFTTQELSEQWGDDWNDAPYEHNAGKPYLHNIYGETPKYDILKIAFDGYYSEACNFTPHVSVEYINKNKLPWLKTEHNILFPAGMSPYFFCRMIEHTEGDFYLDPRKEIQKEFLN